MPLTVCFEDNTLDESSVLAKEEFVSAISRGGLTKPSDYLYIASVHAAALSKFIFASEEVKKTFIAMETFVSCFMKLLENDTNCSYLLDVKCSKGHSHKQFIRRVAFTVFNITGKNNSSQMNDSIRAAKPQKVTATPTKTKTGGHNRQARLRNYKASTC